jgi:hypothetical protein
MSEVKGRRSREGRMRFSRSPGDAAAFSIRLGEEQPAINMRSRCAP